MSWKPIPYAALVATLIACGSASAQSRSAEVPECAGSQIQDRDGDGLSDLCELGIARAFAPLLMVRA